MLFFTILTKVGKYRYIFVKIPNTEFHANLPNGSRDFPGREIKDGAISRFAKLFCYCA
jgi:hypothetical protein